MELEIRNHKLVGEGIGYVSCPKNKEPFKKGYPDSIVIHYTGSTKRSERYLAKNSIKASAHLVIKRSGHIYQLVSFDTESWHAGKSEYNGRKWYNNYAIGIEIENAGFLRPVGEGIYTSWYGDAFDEMEVLKATHRNEDDPRFWHRYSGDDINACYKACQLICQNYGIREILGHEEISPGRKVDPGPAFPLDELRKDMEPFLRK